MSSWSQRRKLLYTIVTLVIIVIPASLIGYRVAYRAPSCFDGIKNGTEAGIDCGGACQKLCQSAFLPPKHDWTQYEQIAPGVYNLAAYVENPNPTVGATNIPFHMVLYDTKGTVISGMNGHITLGPKRNTLAFIPGVRVGNSAPGASPFFEFTAAPDWQKEADVLSHLVVGNKAYSEDGPSSSLQVSLKNAGVDPIPRMSVYAILYDKNKNAIAFSKTVVDGIPSGTSVTAPFTWPENFHGQVISQEILPVAE